MNYKVYQGDELKQTVTSKIAVMNGLQPNQSYVFGVEPDDGKTDFVGANLIVQSDLKSGWLEASTGSKMDGPNDFNSDNYIATNGETVFTFSSPDYVFKGSGADTLAMYDSNKNYLGWQSITSPTQTLSKPNVAYIRFSINFLDEGGTTGNLSDWLANHRYKLEKGSVATTYVATTSVTTRGIRFNIPKTLTVDSTITLRYEEYPLGIVPIGNEPSGYFGGGNKQSLSAKVISTANGSSVVEVAGNVIEVGGRNYLTDSSFESAKYNTDNTDIGNINAGLTSQSNDVAYSGTYSLKVTSPYSGDHGTSIFVPNPLPTTSYVFSGYLYSYSDKVVQLSGYSSGWADIGRQDVSLKAKTWTSFTYKLTTITKIDNVRLGFFMKDDATAFYIDQVKLEPGDIATPYASFVDGDTFTAQPDGTCALFSEHKALYY